MSDVNYVIDLIEVYIGWILGVFRMFLDFIYNFVIVVYCIVVSVMLCFFKV